MDWAILDALNSRDDPVVWWLPAVAVFVAAKADGIGVSLAGVLRALAAGGVPSNLTLPAV